MRIALASGLHIGGSTPRKAELLLLRAYLLGDLGDTEDRRVAQSIQHFLIAGGLHADEVAEISGRCGLSGPKRRRGGFGSLAATELTVAVEEADLFLAPLGVKGMTLHIQSGEGDCGVSTFLPQEPIPRAIFPRCTRSGNLELRRNPSDHCIAGLQVVGHSGQPLALASRNAPKGAPVSHMDMLLQSWQSQYLAPLWPELLMKADAVPERQDDPFGIKLRPEAQKVLLFSGNSPGARWELAPGLDSAEPLGQKDVLAVCIPKFQEEPTILLVDSEDLSVQQLRFSVS